MWTHRAIAALALVLLLGLTLATCKRQDDEAERNGIETASGDETLLSPAQVAEAPNVFAERSPGDPGETVLTPATTLIPGSADITIDIPNPYQGDPRVIAAGKRDFDAFNCSGCHAPLGGGGMGPALSDSDWIYGSKPAQIYMSILQGRPEGMPAWGTMLPRRTIWELVTFIQNLPNIRNPAEEEGFRAHPKIEVPYPAP
jgi:cytochrome c oxidase cbb3-type subunit 3